MRCKLVTHVRTSDVLDHVIESGALGGDEQEEIQIIKHRYNKTRKLLDTLCRKRESTGVKGLMKGLKANRCYSGIYREVYNKLLGKDIGQRHSV